MTNELWRKMTIVTLDLSLLKTDGDYFRNPLSYSLIILLSLVPATLRVVCFQVLVSALFLTI